MYRRGFTIVELLIVIVVIAILATITVVAYNGVTNRAIISSMKSDLSGAAKKMALAKVDNNDAYPSDLPAGITTSNGTILQMTSVSNPAQAFCINAYGTGNRVASISTANGLQDYLCAGVTIGTAVGGTVPTAPRNTNLLAGGFSTWTTTGGMSYNASTDEMVCNNSTSGQANSPLIRVDGPTSGKYNYDAYATVPSSTRAYSGSYGGTSYYASDGTTAAYNTAASPGPYNGNGNAPALPAALGDWHAVNWTLILGPAIIYTRLRIQCDVTANGYTSDTHYKNPYFSVQ